MPDENGPRRQCTLVQQRNDVSTQRIAPEAATSSPCLLDTCLPAANTKSIDELRRVVYITYIFPRSFRRAGARAKREIASPSAFCNCSLPRMKLNVYIDGFNLYYGSLKNTPFKWLDLLKMSQLLFPNDQINNVKYFTARVSARRHDLDQPIRQQTYFRALQTLPGVEIIEGRFLTKPTRMPLAIANPPQFVQVVKTEEKGSDVNLAVHLLHDAYRGDFEVAAMVTNDSDLLEPMRIVQTELNLPVGLVNPQTHPSFHLRSQATFMKTLRPGVLRASQLPSSLTDTNGTFHKPTGW